MTIKIIIMGLPNSDTMYWHFLVKMDVGPIFYINIVHCVYMKAEIPILPPTKPLMETFLFGDFCEWNVHCSVNWLIHKILKKTTKLIYVTYFEREQNMHWASLLHPWGIHGV